MGFIRNQIHSAFENRNKIGQIFFKAIIVVFLLTNLTVIIYRFIPVFVTPLMVIRAIEKKIEGQPVHIQKEWVSRDKISINLQKAVISSEDPQFFTHRGFDFKAIKNAMKANRYRKVKLGASTITQQTAKNVFLYPARNYIRKALEAYFTVLIELYWSKERILEVYLNVIELGDGVYGAQAASLQHFKKPASELTQWESSLFAAILPNPRRFSPTRPTSYILRRRNFVMRNMGQLGREYFSRLEEKK